MIVTPRLAAMRHSRSHRLRRSVRTYAVSIRTYLLTAAAAMIDELHHLAEQTIG